MRRRGFTLVELLVVLAIVALLLSIVTPRFLHKTEQAREVVLRENLAGIRAAIDQYYGDRNTYPPSLAALVEAHYLRRIPPDPITDRDDTWQLTLQTVNGNTGVFDIHSGAMGYGRNGAAYASW